MVDNNTISIILTGIGLIIALTYYGLQIRNQNKTRQAQIAMNFYTHVTNKEFWLPWTKVLYTHEFSNWQEWTQKYGPNDIEATSDLLTVMQIFVGSGIMLKNKILDPEELFEYIPHVTIPMTYLKLKPFIDGMRITYNDAKFGDSFEYLYNEAIRLYPDMSIPSDRAKVIKIPKDS